MKKNLKTLLLLIPFMACSSLQAAPTNYEFWNLSKFNIETNALGNLEPIRLLYGSGGPEDSHFQEFYYHFLAVTQNSQDTFNILTPVSLGRSSVDSTTVYFFISEGNPVTNYLYLSPEEMMASEGIDLDLPRPERRDLISRNPGYDHIADNDFPTVIGGFGILEDGIVSLEMNLYSKKEITATCEGDCWNGYGELTWEDGGCQKGTWKDGKLHGKGSVLQGEFTDPPGELYEGDFLNGQRHGHGVCVFVNGVTYTGEWKDGAINGKGRLDFGPETQRPGSFVEGNFKDGAPDGYAIMHWSLGEEGSSEVYEGYFVDGNTNGKGRMEYKNGNTYVGGWKDDQKHGKGVYTFADGRKCKGKWELGYNAKHDQMRKARID